MTIRRKRAGFPSLVAASLVGVVVGGTARAQAPAAGAGASAARPMDASKGDTDTQKAIRGRVTSYWDARRATNLHAAYPFYESTFRAKYTADQFARDFRRLNRFAPELIGIESIDVDATGKKATVKVKLRAKIDALDGRELDSVVSEDWVLEEGTWMRAGEALLPNI